MLEDSFSGIATFLAVVEAGSFAAAAERLNVTRSAVAKAVARLETRLAVRLFHRTTRQQSLTDEGRNYYEHCQRIMGDLRDVEAALHDGSRALEGQVRISAPVLFGRRCVAPVLRTLARQHPQLVLEAEFSDRVVDVLADGFDLVVRIGAMADSSSLVARKIGRQHMAIYASPAYLSQHGQPTTIAELAGHTAIVYSRGGQAAGWPVLDHEGNHQTVYLNGRQRYDDLQVMADAAIDNGGLAWLPCWLAEPHVAKGELIRVMDSDQVLAIDIHAVWPRNRYLPLRTRTLIDALLEQVPPMMAD